MNSRNPEAAMTEHQKLRRLLQTTLLQLINGEIDQKEARLVSNLAQEFMRNATYQLRKQNGN